MGMSFVSRLQSSTGADSACITRAYIVSRDIFGMDGIWQQLEMLDDVIEPAIQREMMMAVVKLVRRSTRWFVRNRRKAMDPADEVVQFKNGVQEISSRLEEFLHGDALDVWRVRCAGYRGASVPKEVAEWLAGAPLMYQLLGLVEAGRTAGVEFEQVAQTYFLLSARLNLHWYTRQLLDLTVNNQWEALARESFQDDLDWQRRALTVGVLKLREPSDTPEENIERWVASQEALVDRWLRILSEVNASNSRDYPLFSVANRELLDLAQAS
jgi:glutamate dehydrogenase